MKLPGILVRHPALAWLAPSAIVVGLAAVAMGAFTSSSSTAQLPQTSPQALIASVRAAANSAARGYSGTIIVDASLGVPTASAAAACCAASSAADSASESDASDDRAVALSSILAGTHTLRFWYGGPQRQRVAMLRPTSEADFFHDGTNLWEWDSATGTASHTTVTGGSLTLPISFAALTPQQLMNMVLAAGGSDSTKTAVSLGAPQTVAGRPCYAVVITPRSTTTRIGSVHVAVDSVTKVPLSVQVYARGSAQPSLDATFSSVTFKRPAASYFAFTPPPATKAVPVAAGAPSMGASDAAASSGRGWSTVMEYRGSAATTAQLGSLASALLKPVTGKWGKGELFTSPLLCVLATNDGRIYMGAVDPHELYAAALAAPSR